MAFAGKAPERKEEIQKPPMLPSAYVLCEASKKDLFLSFLRKNKAEKKFDAVAVLETPDREVVEALIEEKLCATIASPCSEADPAIKVSIYPSFSRNSLCESALGMDHSFAASFLRKDFEEGRKSLILIAGLDPFTGKEPKAYQEKVLSYIRELARMEVLFVKDTSNSAVFAEKQAAKAGASEKAAPKDVSGQGQMYTLNTKTNIVSAMDLRNIPVGSKVYFPDKKIITPLAKDVIRDRKLTIIG